MHHGHGGKKDEVDIDAERFFRAVDRAVLEYYSRPSNLPLILAALPEHHHRFHQVSQNPLLVAEGIRLTLIPCRPKNSESSPGRPSNRSIRRGCLRWPRTSSRPRSKGLGGDDLAQVAQAAASGRVATLLIESDRQIAGRLDGATGRVEAADLSDPQVDDLLDDLGELVAKMGGRVLVIPAERMPDATGLAATYRY